MPEPRHQQFIFILTSRSFDQLHAGEITHAVGVTWVVTASSMEKSWYCT